MSASIQQIRVALKDAIVTKIGEADQQVSAYVRSNPTLPMVWVRPNPDTPIDYHKTMGARVMGQAPLEYWTFLVEAYTGAGEEIAAQVRLDEYLSPGAKSIFEALEADVTLAGLVQNVIVRECRSYVEMQRADGSVAIGANWLVEIYP